MAFVISLADNHGHHGATSSKHLRELPGVQWLDPHALAAKGPGLIPDWGTRILHVMQYGQKQKKQQTPKLWSVFGHSFF